MHYFYYILEIAIIGVVGTAPAFRAWRKAVHQRRLSRCKLEISEAVLEMEKLMLSGELELGDACHDRIFKVMQTVQNLHRFPVPWSLPSETQESKLFKSKFREELTNKNSNAWPHIHKFVGAYFRAFMADNPNISQLYILYLGGMLVFLVFRASGFLAVKKVIKFKISLSRLVQEVVARSCQTLDPV